ncbi:MAG: tRNA pseudouridine synthase A [Ignavibacteria bacterium]|nr:tRNA pseudouridine synthase A [Ignavibacteria bacterium]
MQKKYNYKIIIEYDGERYKGWQKQRNTKETIQEYIETAINTLIKEKVKLIGAGRTDSEVNAYNQCANFFTNQKIEKKKFLHSINGLLPSDITIKKIQTVQPDFHSRYSARKREYIYKITLFKKSIESKYYFHLKYKLNYELVDEFIEFLKHNEYFKSLCKNKTDKHNFKCKIYNISYKLIKSELIIKIIADRFLHSMVRGIVGCMIDIGRGKTQLEEAKEKILKGERLKTFFVPGRALFLKQIYY